MTERQTNPTHPRSPGWRLLLSLGLAFWLSAAAADETRLTLTLNDIALNEVMQMLSQQQKVNILISEGVEGRISVNLYDVTLDRAIRSISEAAGFAVEYRDGSYFIVDRDEAERYGLGGLTELRTFQLHYANTEDVEVILEKHLSSYGKITRLEEQRMLVVEDEPSFLRRIERLIRELDREPKQILIEAKILQVALQDNESFGLDWKKLFSAQDGSGSFGTRGLANLASSGLFFNLVNSNIEVALDALKSRGRLRTLSSPKLLALEHQEAYVIVGEEQGYPVTTTINQVTTETIEFLSSGIILRVTSWANENGEILMDIAPEVSTGSVSNDGIPSKSTTQVSTHMLVSDGQTVFIGGLLKQSINQSREGIPVLGDLPVVNLLFANHAKNFLNTETVILITPKIVGTGRDMYQSGEVAATRATDRIIQDETTLVRKRMDRVMEQNRWLNGPLPVDEADSEAVEAADSHDDTGDEPWFLEYNR